MNYNLGCFLLSKDRPMEFDGCYRSIQGQLPINQYYFLLNGDEHQYQTVFRDNYPMNNAAAEFEHPHTSFKQYLKNALEYLKKSNDFVLLMTDDTLVYRKLNSTNESLLKKAFEVPDTFTFSLRLGLYNTIYQDPLDHTKKIEIPNNIWNWQLCPEDRNTGYPISMDGHIYRTQDMLDLIEKVEFNNLREWEANLMSYVRGPEFKDKLPLMSCLHRSCCVNIPMETVQGNAKYNSGSPYFLSNQQMTEKWKQGYRIDLDKTFEGVNINGSHCFIPLKFKKK